MERYRPSHGGHELDEEEVYPLDGGQQGPDPHCLWSASQLHLRPRDAGVKSGYSSVHNYSTYPMLLHKCSKNVVFLNEICS